MIPGPSGIQTGPPPVPGAPPVQQQAAASTTPPRPQLDPEVFDYPENTALANMTVEQQAEYWRHKARKHENTVKSQQDYAELKAKAEQYEALVQASQTEHERAVAEARRQGQAEALAAAGGQLVEQWVRAAAAGRLQEDSVTALLGALDRRQFLSPDGAGVDTDKVWSLVNSLIPATPVAPQATVPVPTSVPVTPPVPQPAPAPTGVPDFGQGQAPASRPTGLAAGRAIAQQRFGTKPTQ